MINTFKKIFNGSLTNLLSDLKFLILFVSIISGSVALYYSMEDAIKDNTKAITFINKNLIDYRNLASAHQIEDKEERKNIRDDIQHKYKERVDFQQSILGALGNIQGKLEVLTQEKHK